MPNNTLIESPSSVYKVYPGHKDFILRKSRQLSKIFYIQYVAKEIRVFISVGNSKAKIRIEVIKSII
jgi:hypothetical protein